MESSFWHFAMTFTTDFVLQWKTGDDAAVSMGEPSGNVVADLGLKNPEEHLARSPLVQRIPFSTASVTNAPLDCAEKRNNIDHKSAAC